MHILHTMPASLFTRYRFSIFLYSAFNMALWVSSILPLPSAKWLSSTLLWEYHSIVTLLFLSKWERGIRKHFSTSLLNWFRFPGELSSGERWIQDGPLWYPHAWICLLVCAHKDMAHNLKTHLESTYVVKTAWKTQRDLKKMLIGRAYK